MDAMLLLEGDAMRKVHDDFKAVQDAEHRGLTLDEFITAMVRHVDTSHREPRALVKMLVDLFQCVTRAGVCVCASRVPPLIPLPLLPALQAN